MKPKKKNPPPAQEVKEFKQLGRFREALIVLGLASVLTLVIFSQLLNSRMALNAGDSPPLKSHVIQQGLRAGFLANWNPFTGLGTPSDGISSDWQTLVYMLVPEMKAIEAIMAIASILTTLFLFLFLRDRKYSFFASLVGAFAFSFSTSMISLCYAGHLGHFPMLAFLAGALWLIGKTFRDANWIAAIFAGLFLAMVLTNDVALFMLLVGIGPFWLREMIAKGGTSLKEWRTLALMTILVGVVALVVAAPAMGNVLGAVHGTASGTPVADPEQNWQWATQWSLPVIEVFRLICAGFFGWDSGNPEGPYWGGIGRSPGWEQTHQGFRNFTQTNEYLGVVIVALALIALLAYGRRLKHRRLTDDESSPPADTIFWGAVALVSVLLCFGKHFPLYRLFYSLPYVSSIRNPVKFIHLASLAVSMLAAQGAMHIENVLRARPGTDRWGRLVPVIAPGILVLIFAGVLIAAPWEGGALPARWAAEGFSQEKSRIIEVMISGLSISLCFGIIMLILGALINFKPLGANRWTRGGVYGVIFCAVVIDLALAGRHYVRYDNATYLYASNTLISYLRGFPSYRTKFVPHTWGIFNYWNLQLTSYHGFRSADAPAMSRPPADLEAFYQAFGSTPWRLWQITGVRHLVLPRELEKEIRQMGGNSLGEFKGFDLVQGFQGIDARWADKSGEGRFVVLEYPGALPTPKWYGKTQWVDFDGAISKLKDPNFDVADTLLLDAGSTVDPLVKTNQSQIAAGTSKCELLTYTYNRIRADVEASSAGWLFINDYYDSGWKATVDGKPVPVVKADGIFRAVPVPAGRHEVELVYRVNPGYIIIPLVGFAIAGLLLAAVYLSRLVFKRKKTGK